LATPDLGSFSTIFFIVQRIHGYFAALSTS
jgi:hypothetical protein